MTKRLKILTLIILGTIVLFATQPASAQTPINCGQVIIGSISVGTEQDRYTFSASAGDKVTIRASRISGTLYPYLKLYSPTGSFLTQAANQIDRTLTTSGVYTIIVTDEHSFFTGDYAITWHRFNNPCSTNINCGRTITGSIGNTTDNPPWRFYYFTASSGNKITIRASSGDIWPSLELYAPDGTKIAETAQISNAIIDKTLTLTGTYTIVVQSDYDRLTGDFRLTWQKLNNPCYGTIAALNCAQVVTGSVTATELWKLYTFSASAGDKVIIRFAKLSGNITLELYNPEGIQLSGINLSSVTLSLTGTYTIIIHGNSETDTGNYVLTWQKLNNPCNVADISFATPVTVRISNFLEIDAYKFYAYANDKIRVDATQLNQSYESFNLHIDLYDSTGTKIPFTPGTPTLGNHWKINLTGPVYLFVTGGGSIGTGLYQFTLQCLNNPRAPINLNFGQTTSGTISTFTDIDVYAFTVSANDKVLIDYSLLTETVGYFEPLLELYDPTGTLLAYKWGNDAGRFNTTIPASGTCYLFVSSDNSDGAGTYELSLQRTNNPANTKDLTYETVIEDSLEAFTEMDVYRFLANTNDKITICSGVKTVTSDYTFGGFNCYLELYDSNGTQLAYSSSGSLKYTFTSSGTFYLFISNSNLYGTGSYRFILSRGDILCSNLDFLEPQVLLYNPKAGEIIKSSSNYIISWMSSDNVGITSHEIRLSSDSGQTYPTVIASNLAASVHYYNWQIPADLFTTKGRIKVIAYDARGNAGWDENKADFVVINTNLPLAAKEIDYEYDKLNRLTKSIPKYGLKAEYIYDALGNRLNLITQTLYTFQDVPPSYWAWRSIEDVYHSGIASGCRYDSTTNQRWYCPEDQVTRAQMAVFLARALKLPDYTGPQIFTDVPPTYWAYKQIGAVYRAGITSGCNATQFCPDGIVNRAQMAVFLARALKLPDYTGAQIFSDVPPTYWAYKQIGAIYKAGITSGCTSTKYCPESPITRAQMAVFLDRAFINKTY